MAISTNPNATIYRNLYENKAPVTAMINNVFYHKRWQTV